MRQLKKLTAFVLAMVMTLAMTTVAFASNNDANGNYSITIKNSVKGHTYEAYQILAGDLATVDGAKVLSNVTWGSGVKDSVKTVYGENAAEFAESLKQYANDSSEIIAVANELNKHLGRVAGSTSTVVNGVYTISGLEAGYYLIKDSDGTLDGSTESYTRFVLKVVESVDVTPKASTTTVEKKLKDTNDTTGETTDWQDGADYDIGDVVPFKLTATLAANVSAYDTYKLIFHDTLSAGLTYNNDYKIYIDGKEVKEGFVASYEGTTLTFACDDVKPLGATNNSEVVVEYTATLNENAIIGSKGNPNKVYLEFSNNPNKGMGGETGNTPEDTVIVFTYKVVVNKIDGNTQEPLAGAEFTLLKKLADGTTKVCGVVMSEAGTQFSFNGLDDGDYILKETKTPAGYNTIDDIEFTVTAEHDIISDDPRLTSLTGDAKSGVIEFSRNSDNDGELDTTVENKKGTVLPETGGAGRVFIYVLGVVLVLGAGIVLVSKKRAAR